MVRDVAAEVGFCAGVGAISSACSASSMANMPRSRADPCLRAPVPSTPAPFELSSDCLNVWKFERHWTFETTLDFDMVLSFSI